MLTFASVSFEFTIQRMVFVLSHPISVNITTVNVARLRIVSLFHSEDEKVLLETIQSIMAYGFTTCEVK